MHRPPAHLTNLDLNLLVALRELIRERNVTRAAERIGVTQPAASAALARLRRHFDDELLTRAKDGRGGRGGYELTPLAALLAEQVEELCAAAERLFATGTDFDPATSGREFTLLMADYTIAVMGERLSQRLEATAPRIKLHVKLVRESLAAGLADTIRSIDGIVAPPVNLLRASGIRSAGLFRDRWVLVVSAKNQLLDTEAPGVDDLARLDWVAPFHPNHPYPSAAPITRQLALLGIRPRLAVRVESYQAVPQFVAGTDRIALMQERLVAQLTDRLGLKALEPPIELEPIIETLWWHEDHDHDPAHAWLRGLIIEAARSLQAR
ncbi:MAG TPA: LysR substrate-binding domain-containing protein [Streptosporangiaceae bacterium]|nr:LysR substrate-binding domain-containing protein [Streptosporangiaceae bacterium]